MEQKRKIYTNNVNRKFIARSEARLSRKVKRSFTKQIKWIVEELPSSGIVDDQTGNASVVFNEIGVRRKVTNQNEGDIDIFLNDLPGNEEIADILRDAEGRAMMKGGRQIVRDLKLSQFGISFSLKHPDAKRYLLARHTLEKLSNYRGNIHGVTKQKIRDILVVGIEEGKSYTQLAKEIKEQGKEGVFSIARAEHIAQREIGMAYSHGNRVPIDDFAIGNPNREILKRWNTVKDARVRFSHATNEADGWIPLNQVHSGTGEDKAPSNDWRCRCAETYRITDE